MVMGKKRVLRPLIAWVSEWNFLKAELGRTTWRRFPKHGKEAVMKDTTSVNAYLKVSYISRGREKKITNLRNIVKYIKK